MVEAKKIVVITGISHGIGHALAREFLKEKWNVFGCARSKPDDSKTKEFNFNSLDVSNYSQVKSWSENIISKVGSPQILINNASIINKNSPLWKIPTADFDSLIDINIKGVANVLRAFLPSMIDSSQGIIVNISSGWGTHGAANVSSYCASKFAIEGLTQSLAQELSAGLIAISLSPGIVKTRMLQSCSPDYYEKAIEPKEWAKKAVPFICGLTPKQNGASLRCVVD